MVRVRSKIGVGFLATLSVILAALTWSAPNAQAETQYELASCGTIRHDATTEKSWLSEETNPATDVIGAAVVATFGSLDKERPLRQLEGGYLGTAIDDEAQALVIVVDPQVADVDLLRKALAGSDLAGFPVRLQEGCHSAQELLDSGARLMDELAMRAMVGDTYAFELNPYISKWDAFVQEGPETTALSKAFGETVNFTTSEQPAVRQSGSRTNDQQPHWGGARIGRASDANSICTSGVTVDTATAGKAILTAAHCFNVGNNIVSGSYAYGELKREAPYPAYDLAVINASTQDYDDDIYANPVRDITNPYDVSGKKDASVGNQACFSGGWSQTTCGLNVEGTNAQLCDADGCTYGLLRYNQSGSACQPGDSGGPIFRAPNSPDNALIYGQHVGEISNGCVGEHVLSIENGLDVTVATSPN